MTYYMQGTRLGIVSETKVNKIQSLPSDANSLEEKIKQVYRQHNPEKEIEDSILNGERRSHPQYILDISAVFNKDRKNSIYSEWFSGKRCWYEH